MNNITIENITGEQIKSLLNNNNLDSQWDLPVIEIDDDSYIVASSEEEATAAVTEAIKNSLCYFNPSFLSDMTELPVEVFDALAKCDFSDNDVYLQLIESSCGIEDFVENAVDCDGRGHFLASYDLKEREIDGYFLYRI